MWVALTDGRTLGVPLVWFPRLLHASPEQREVYDIIHDGLHWDALDEDIFDPRTPGWDRRSHPATISGGVNFPF